MFNGDANNYTANSGNSYTWVTQNITVSESFNTTHSNSHNGHGRGGWCGVVALLLFVGVPVAILWAVASVLIEVLR